MEPKRFKGLLRRTVVLPLLAMTVLAGALLLEAYDLYRAMQWVDHSDQVILSSRIVLRSMIDLEADVRGYLLTGNDEFLQPYRRSRQALDSNFEFLNGLMADSPAQQQRLARLRDSYTQWQRYADEMIRLRQTGGAYADNALNLEEQRRMDAIRGQYTELRGAEERLRDERNHAAQAHWRMIALSCIVLVLSVGIFIVAFTSAQMRTLASEFQHSLDLAEARSADLVRSEQRWATTLTSIGDAVMATDASGKITFINALAESLLQCTLDECAGKPVEEVFKLENEQTGTAVESPVALAMRQNRVVELGNHVVLIGGRGARTPIADSAAPIRDAEGNMTGVVLVFRDVTERQARERERDQALEREKLARQVAEDTTDRLRKIQLVTEAALAHLPLQEMLNRLLGRTAEALQAEVAVILLLNEKTQMLEVNAALGLDEEVVRSVHVPMGVGIAGTIAKTAELRIVEDLSEADVFSPYLRERASSLMGAPLVVEDRVIGVIHVDSNNFRRFTESEAALLQLVADRIAVAIDRKRAEDALETAKQKAESTAAQLRTIIDSMTERVYVCDQDGQPVLTNAAFNAGYLGQAPVFPQSFIDAIETFDIAGHPMRMADWPIARALRGERVRGVEMRVRFKHSGQEVIGSYNASPVLNGQGNVLMAVLTVQDITDRKWSERQLHRLNRTLQALSNADQALLHATTEEALFQQICNTIVEDCGYAMVWIGFAENDENKTVRPVAHAGFEQGYLANLQITWADSERGRGPAGTPIRTGRPHVCPNILTDPAFELWRVEAIKRGYASALGLPLNEDGRAFGAITIYSREPDAFFEDEVKLLADLAADLAYGIRMLRVRAARERAEEAVLKSRDLLQTFIKEAPVALAMFDRNMRYLQVSRRWLEETGLGDKTILGKSHYDVFPYLPEHWREMHQLAMAGESVKAEEDWIAADGKAHTIAWETHPWGDAGIETGGVIISFADLTERKRAEQAMRASERRFRELADAMPQIVWASDPDGSLDYYNRKWYELTGAVEGEQGDRSWLPILHPDDRQKCLDVWYDSVKTGKPYQIEYRFKFPSTGEHRWHLGRALPVRDQEGKIIRWYGTCTDIHEFKKTAEALRASEERWATTLQSIGDAVISTDATGKIAFMNDVAQRVTGWSLAEAKGIDLTTVFDIVQEVTRIRPENPVSKVLRLGKVIGLANHTLLVRRDGIEVPIEDSGSPIRDREGNIQGVVLVFHDVSEQRKLEKALRESERLATTGRLAATIAHEIHNPLDTVGNLLFLMRHSTKESETHERVLMASEELARVTQITQQMLTFHRESAEPIPVRVEDILNNVLALYERKIQSANIKVEKEFEFQGTFLAQPGELRQVFANLLGNAIAAAEKDCGAIRVRLRASRNWRNGHCGLRVLIADNGHGVPPEIREKIFDPFFTTKGESGTGLGLWIATGIISKYRGTIHLRSTAAPGSSGTCFSVFLPCDHSGGA